MKSLVALVVGLAVGAAVAAGYLQWSQANADATLAAQLAAAKQALVAAERSAKAAREDARLAREQLAAAARDAAPSPAPVSSAGPATTTGDPRNTAILTYLGDPVRAPADLDPKYAPAQLAATFRSLCEARGVKVTKLGVDTSEFPYVVHGLLEGETAQDFFLQINTRLRAAPGYAYGGSVTGRTSDGALHFSLHMTPNNVLPRDQADTLRRRLMLRLQMIDAAWVDLVR